MSKAAKIWLITASVLIVLGLFVFAGAMSANDWDFSKLATVSYVTNTYEITDDFHAVAIDVDTTEITFAPAEDGCCRIVCEEEENRLHCAAVQNDTLVITLADTRRWYDHIGISFGAPKMTVYLPQSDYASLYIETDTGDVTIPEAFTFGVLHINSDTGDVDCAASVTDTAKIDLDTGDLQIQSAVMNQIGITTDTGDITLTDIACQSAWFETDTGDVALTSVIADGRLAVETDTGDVTLKNSDAADIAVETATGDVNGTLLTGKVFSADTSTGRVRIPPSTAGGNCRIVTSTGDIDLAVVS